MIAATSNRMGASELAQMISLHGGNVRLSKASRKTLDGFRVKTLQLERRNGSLDNTSVNDAGDLA
ncbi:hypothetical protein A4U53_034430 [Rhizobium ruizarguesonis]|uniref:Uncharacterized protein n=1 Tax=Rhizobium ruizarguesonis TaxID=2081791 RepID=A0ACD5ENY8_9HYPH